MTKTMKRFISILLSVMMLCTLGITVMAEDEPTYPVSITKANAGDELAHDFELYQIFDAKVHTDGKLYDVTWGEGVDDGDAIIDDLKAISAFAECETLEDVIDVLETLDNDSATLDAFAKVVGEHLASPSANGTIDADKSEKTVNVEKAGYYLVKDTIKDEDSKTVAESKFMMKVVNNTTNAITITTKEVVPSLDKKIVETAGDTDKNTASVGELITFKLSSSVPDLRNSGYNKYCFVMNDTLSEGLTYDATTADLTVTIGGVELTEGTDYTFTKTETATGTALKIVFKDMLDRGLDEDQIGDDIIVTYKASLNENAVLTDEGNPNTANLIYSNDPSHDYTSDEPGSTEPKGQTPDVETITYTTGVDIVKIDASDNSRLDGAEFKIEGTKADQVITKKQVFVVDADEGTYYKLKDGTFTTTAPTTETEASYASDDKYKLTEVNEITEKVSEVVKTEVGTDGALSFNGLGVGEYTITEVKAPEGYVMDETPHTVVITCTYDTDGKPVWSYKVDDADATTNRVTLTITNTKPSELPSTGGIGTTIFYIGGVALVLGGVVLLVLKKKNAGKE